MPKRKVDPLLVRLDAEQQFHERAAASIRDTIAVLMNGHSAGHGPHARVHAALARQAERRAASDKFMEQFRAERRPIADLSKEDRMRVVSLARHGYLKILRDGLVKRTAKVFEV